MEWISDPALEAILQEWNPNVYDPPHTDIQGWTHTIEALCHTYGIPDNSAIAVRGEVRQGRTSH